MFPQPITRTFNVPGFGLMMQQLLRILPTPPS
jgi:hypothetical protein